MPEHNGNKHWSEYFRLLTPVLLFILTMVSTNATTKLSDVKLQLMQIDDKMFKHLTNDEVHAPRNQTVSKMEYDQHVKEKEKVVDRIYQELVSMRQEIQRLKN